MFRFLVNFVLAVAIILVAASSFKNEKEISSANAMTVTTGHPCALIVMASNDPAAVPLPKPKPHIGVTKHKKKIANTPTKHKKKNHTHHHSHHHHHHHSPPAKIFGAHGPSHLTSPPGCG